MLDPTSTKFFSCFHVVQCAINMFKSFCGCLVHLLLFMKAQSCLEGEGEGKHLILQSGI